MQGKINEKKAVLTKNGFNLSDPEVTNIDYELNSFKEKLKNVTKEMRDTYKNFCGIAFISFATENEKSECLERFEAA